MREITISAIILTHPDAERIAQTVKSVDWCDEIIVVVDATTKIQKLKFKIKDDNSKLKIISRVLNDDFAEQRNFGLSKAKNDWVLFLDSDEEISEELKVEIKSQISKKDGINGFYIKRKDYFLGKWLEFGETSKVQLLRLAKKTAGEWKGRVHEQWLVVGQIGRLNNPILHYPHPSISAFLSDINRYTDLVAQSWKEEGRRMGIWEILVYPKLKFFQNYLLRLGFLDGIPGLIVALMMSFHSFLARAKYYHMQKRLASSV